MTTTIAPPAPPTPAPAFPAPTAIEGAVPGSEPAPFHAVVHRWTVEEYDRMVELGALDEDLRVELLDGLIVDKMPNNPPHANPVRTLNRFFVQRENNRWLTQCLLPMRLPEQRSEPEPDILLLRLPDQRYARRHPEPADVFLLIEVADSSLRTDRGEKLRVYARAGIPEYWILNVPERKVEVYREPDPTVGCFSTVREVRSGEGLAPAAFPDAAVDTAELLG